MKKKIMKTFLILILGATIGWTSMEWSKSIEETNIAVSYTHLTLPTKA